MSLTLESVLITDEIDVQCVEILRKNGVKVTKNTKFTKEQLLNEIGNYDGLIVRSATKVTADVIMAASRLKIIGRAGTGVDNIDCDAATKRGIIVMNTPGGNTLSAAELTCTLLLTSARHVAQGTASLKEGRWDRKKYMGNEVYGKTLAIVGLGRIGKEVALRMQSFGMTTIGYDPIIPGSVSAEFNTEWMELEELWPKADYITVHTPLIPQTKNLISDDVFSKCKKNVRIINCARGGIVDEDALLRALNSGQCGGAGLDVFVQEPPANRALVEHPLVTCTPHLGASTVEAQSRVAVEIAEQFIDAMNGKSLFGAINAQALSQALSATTQPLVSLGIQLGKFIKVFLQNSIQSNTAVTVVTQGNGLKKSGNFLGAAALVGMLGGGQANGLNLISAPAVAKEKGIKVESKHLEGNSDLVTLQVTTLEGTAVNVSGIVAGDTPMLTGVQGSNFQQYVVLQGAMLVYKSQAQGQVLTAVTGTVCAAGASVTGVSISQEVNGECWSVMKLSQSVPTIEPLKLHVNYANQVVV